MGEEDKRAMVPDGANATLGATTDLSTEDTVVGLIKRLIESGVTVIVSGTSDFSTDQLPAALGEGGGLKIEGVAGGVAVATDVSTVTLPTAVYNGVKAVTTATTREALGASQALKSGVQIKAHLTNTGVIYVGNATVAAANGYRLNAGESIFLEIDNLALVYLDVSVNGEGVSYVAS